MIAAAYPAVAIIVFFSLLSMTGMSCSGPAAAAVDEPAYMHVVDSLVDSLSVREKFAQLLVVTADNRYDQARKAEEDHSVRDEKIGGIILMGKDLAAAMERTNHLQSLADIPLLEFMDAEWGASMRLTGFQPFPRQSVLSRLPSDSLVYEMGRAVAAELRQIHVNVNFAPDIDINNNPDNIVIGTRSFGSDKEVVARFGSAYMRGMQDGGIIACAKHFPGHGDTSVDSHKGLPVLNFTRERLDEFELYPFRRLVSDGVGMIMVGHLSVPCIDSTSTPASVSRPLVTGLLRDQLGFEGLIVCDALNMKGILNLYEGNAAEAGAKACLAAYKAGVDILLMPMKVSPALDLLEQAFSRGEITLDDLDSRVRRVLIAKGAAGMLDSGYDRYVDVDSIDTAASSALISEINAAVR